MIKTMSSRISTIFKRKKMPTQILILLFLFHKNISNGLLVKQADENYIESEISIQFRRFVYLYALHIYSIPFGTWHIPKQNDSFALNVDRRTTYTRWLHVI